MSLSAIIAPVDFSEDSARGLQLARALARHHQAMLTLVHVDYLPAYSAHVAETTGREAWIEYLEARSSLLAQRLKEFADPVESEERLNYVVVRGEPARAIDGVARANACDLIVISPHGSGFGQRFLLGSVSTQLASDASCPVLVARSRRRAGADDPGTFSHPLVAVSSDALAGPAVAITQTLLGDRAHVDLVHVLEGSEILIEPGLPAGFHEAVERTRDKLSDRFDRFVTPLRKAGVDASVVVETGDPSFSILCRAETSQSDLIVVGRKTLHNGTGLLSTPAYRMVKHALVPVLVVPTRAAA